MGHSFSFCKICETPLDCDFCDKLDTLKEEVHGSWEMVSRWWVCSECGNAVQHGWKNTKQNGKWLNLCPECDEYRRKQKREATLTKDCTGCRWKDRPQKCNCCRRNQNLKDCYEEAQK